MSVRAVGYLGIALAVLGVAASAWAMHVRVRQVPAIEWADVMAASQDVRVQYKGEVRGTEPIEADSSVRVMLESASQWEGRERELQSRLEATYRMSFRVESRFHSRYVNDLSSSDVADWLPRAPGDLGGKVEWEAGGVLAREGDCLYVENGPLRTLLVFPQNNLVAAFDLRSETLLVAGLAYPLGAKVRFGGNDDIPTSALPVRPADTCDTDEYLVIATDVLGRRVRR